MNIGVVKILSCLLTVECVCGRSISCMGLWTVLCKSAQRNRGLAAGVVALCLVGCLELPEPLEVPLNIADAAISDAQRGSEDATEADVFDAPTVDSGRMPTDGDVLVQDDSSGSWDSDVAMVDALVIDATLPFCGDGTLDPSEECDDGGPTDQCSDQCQQIVCGNGRVDPGEACDDGNNDETDGCIDNCVGYFPAAWVPLVQSPTLEIPGVELFYCDGNPPRDVSLNPRHGETHGRSGLRMWTSESEAWIPIGSLLTNPTRVSVSVHVPDGFDRKFRFILATNNPECGGSVLGPYIKHKDRKEAENDPIVEVSAGVRPQAFSYYSIESGQPDQWVALSMVVLPETGHVRFWYGGRYITQIRYPDGLPVGHIRLMAQYEQDAGIGAPIGVSDFIVEVEEPTP